MSKAFILAALLGLAVTAKSSVKSFNRADTPVNTEFFTFSYEIDADFTYGTGFESGVYEYDDVPSSCEDCFQFKKYFLQISS